MAEQRRRATSPDRAADEKTAAGRETKSKQKTEDVLALTDDVLDDIDRALKKACGFDADEIITDMQFEEGASQVVADYQQKPGQ